MQRLTIESINAKRTCTGFEIPHLLHTDTLSSSKSYCCWIRWTGNRTNLCEYQASSLNHKPIQFSPSALSYARHPSHHAAYLRDASSSYHQCNLLNPSTNSLTPSAPPLAFPTSPSPCTISSCWSAGRSKRLSINSPSTNRYGSSASLT